MPLVIFATAFDDYALQAFEADAVGYLLKPIDREKLARAVERALRLLAAPGEAAADRRAPRPWPARAAATCTHVIGRLRDRFVPIPLDDVCFLKVEDGFTRVNTASASFRTDYVLADLAARLPDPPFFRAHRASVVNLRRVREIAVGGGLTLIMADDAASRVQVSERRAAAVRAMLRR